MSPLMNDHVLAYLGTHLLSDYGTPIDNYDRNNGIELEIPFFTEYQRNGFIYRCHPKYQNKDPYYD